MCKSCYRGINLDGKAIEVTVNKDIIEEVKPIPFNTNLPRLLPVLVDLQQNGALSFAYNNMTENLASEQLNKIANHLLKNGVGRILATFTTTNYSRLEQASVSIANVLDHDLRLNSLFFGIFHEGVFISKKEGWRGGHDPNFILSPNWEKFENLNKLTKNRIKLVNIAPEEVGAMEFIKKAVASGIKVSLGHCCPNSKDIREAISNGASMVTHFANGSSPMLHRFDNPFWEFLANDNLSLGLVGDGFHLPDNVVNTALKAKGMDKCFMVSDANIYSGCKAGRYSRIGGLDCQIEENGYIHVVDSEILAGAWFQNNRSVEFLVNKCNVTFEEAWKLCSITPANIIGLDLPQLRVGDIADFVIYENGIKNVVFKGLEI